MEVFSTMLDVLAMSGSYSKPPLYLMQVQPEFEHSVHRRGDR